MGTKAFSSSAEETVAPMGPDLVACEDKQGIPKRQGGRGEEMKK